MLGIKPMILFKDGEIFSGGVARGRQKSFEKALEQLMNYLDAHGGTPDDYRITVGYGYDEEEGKRLWMQTRAALRAKYPGAQCEVGLLQIGCTIAVHTGPYALGMGVMRRWKSRAEITLYEFLNSQKIHGFFATRSIIEQILWQKQDVIREEKEELGDRLTRKQLYRDFKPLIIDTDTPDQVFGEDDDVDQILRQLSPGLNFLEICTNRPEYFVSFTVWLEMDTVS